MLNFEIPQNPTKKPDQEKTAEELIPHEKKPAEKEKTEKPELTISQRIAQAKMEVFLMDSIQKNPHIYPKIIERAVIDHENKYDFTPDQKDFARNLLKAFEQRQNRLDEIQKRYPEAARMYEAITRRPAKGKIKIVRGAASLCVQCSSPEDFAFFPYPDKSYPDLTSAEKDALKSNRGLRPIAEEIVAPEFNDLIIVQQMGGIFSKNDSVLAHEEQHAINSLFREAAGSPLENKELKDEWSLNGIAKKIWDLEGKENEEEKNKTIDLIISKMGEFAYEYIKDEISAFLLSGFSASSTKINLENHYIYNYVEKIKGNLYEKIEEYSRSKAKRDPLDLFGSKLSPEQKAAEKYAYDVTRKLFLNKFFNKRFIEQTIESALNSVALLEKNHFSLKEALALLSKEPLENWVDLAKKITEEQKRT